MKKIIVSLFVLVLLVACSPSTPAPQPEGTTAPSTDPVITVERTGGITGETILYRVFADGRIEAEGADAGSVEPGAVDSVLATLDENGFFEMQSPPQPDTCNDCYQYTISASYNGKTNSITLVDNGNLDAQYQTVINTLLGLVGQ